MKPLTIFGGCLLLTFCLAPGAVHAADKDPAFAEVKDDPKLPLVLLIGDSIFSVDDDGVATCLDAKTGATVWSRRIGGKFTASALYADGRIYFFGEDGKTTVIAAGREFKKLAENQLDSGFMAAPAVSGRRGRSGDSLEYGGGAGRGQPVSRLGSVIGNEVSENSVACRLLPASRCFLSCPKPRS